MIDPVPQNPPCITSGSKFSILVALPILMAIINLYQYAKLNFEKNKINNKRETIIFYQSV